MKTLPVKLFSLLVLAGSTAFAQEPADSLKEVLPFATHALELIHEPGVEVISSMGAPGMVPTIYVHGVPVRPGVEPVYIVDGVRIRTLDGIAPESIEKIEVLKDAAAMGLYGPEAACGVVVVTTRHASRKGFHAGYSFTGGFQALAHEPEKLSIKDWTIFPTINVEQYAESEQPTPEAAFVHNHHVYAQYGAKKWSAYADFSALSNDGPYPGREDRHNRYAASWSVDYRPLKWLSLETTGHWSRSSVNYAPTGWLKDYLVSYPRWADTESTYTNLYRGRSNNSESFVQGKVEIRPLPGVYLRGMGSYTDTWKDDYFVNWKHNETNSKYDDISLNISEDNLSLTQWGVEAGWSGQWKGHRLNLDARFRKVSGKRWDGFFKAAPNAETLGLTTDDIDDLENKVMNPYFESNPRPESDEDLFDWIEQMGKFGLKSARIPSDRFKLDWKETSLSAAYDWKNRYEVGYSFYELWDDKMFNKDAFVVHAVTLGWNPSREPFLRRILPAWWKDWSVKANWAKTGEYISLMNPDAFTSVLGELNSYTYAHRRDLTSTISFQAGKTSVNFRASWYRNDDEVYKPGYTMYVTTYGQTREEHIPPEHYYTFRNRGLDISTDVRGKLGPVNYSAAAWLSIYNNRMTTPEGRDYYYILWSTNDALTIYDIPSVSAMMRNGEKFGGYYLKEINEEGVYSEDYQWMGHVFPDVTGGIRLSAGWNRWQFTIAGHGDWGYDIKHDMTYDALSRHYLENLRTADNPNGYYFDWYLQNSSNPRPYDTFDNLTETQYSLHSGSFFRIDQIRLDYTLPLKNFSLNCFASLENWFLFTKYPGSDPELALALKKIGVETASHPSTRRTLFGLSIGF